MSHSQKKSGGSASNRGLGWECEICLHLFPDKFDLREHIERTGHWKEKPCKRSERRPPRHTHSSQAAPGRCVPASESRLHVCKACHRKFDTNSVLHRHLDDERHWVRKQPEAEKSELSLIVWFDCVLLIVLFF